MCIYCIVEVTNAPCIYRELGKVHVLHVSKHNDGLFIGMFDSHAILANYAILDYNSL